MCSASIFGTLDEERAAWGGADYPTDDKLFCWEDGRLLHPDRITKRFSALVDKTGLPKITPHGVRHSYATVAMDAGENSKTLSERIGHSSVSFTMQTYVQRSAGHAKNLADNVARLIVRPQPPADWAPALSDAGERFGALELLTLRPTNPVDRRSVGSTRNGPERVVDPG